MEKALRKLLLEDYAVLFALFLLASWGITGISKQRVPMSLTFFEQLGGLFDVPF